MWRATPCEPAERSTGALSIKDHAYGYVLFGGNGDGARMCQCGHPLIAHGDRVFGVCTGEELKISTNALGDTYVMFFLRESVGCKCGGFHAEEA